MPSSNPLKKFQQVINKNVFKNRLSTFWYWSLRFLANNFFVNFLDRFQQIWIHGKILRFGTPSEFFEKKISVLLGHLQDFEA
jgi:hypothetical protein